MVTSCSIWTPSLWLLSIYVTLSTFGTWGVALGRCTARSCKRPLIWSSRVRCTNPFVLALDANTREYVRRSCSVACTWYALCSRTLTNGISWSCTCHELLCDAIVKWLLVPGVTISTDPRPHDESPFRWTMSIRAIGISLLIAMNEWTKCVIHIKSYLFIYLILFVIIYKQHNLQ